MNIYKNFLQYSIVCLIFIFQSCVTTPINLTVAKDEVIKYHESGKYDKETAKVIDAAISEFKNIFFRKGSLIIFIIL